MRARREIDFDDEALASVGANRDNIEEIHSKYLIYVKLLKTIQKSDKMLAKSKETYHCMYCDKHVRVAIKTQHEHTKKHTSRAVAAKEAIANLK